MRARVFWSMVAFVLCAAAARASDEREKRLSPAHFKWLKEEVTYIITDLERETFLNLEGQEDRDAFIAAFWRKRDPNPTTPENEFRDEHYLRLEYANKFYGRDTFRPGWMTARGRYHILLGPPRERQFFDAKDEIYPAELWFYNNPELQRFGLPSFFYLLFFRRHGGGELELYSPLADGPQELLTGVSARSMDFRKDIETAYNKLSEISPELAQASISFRTDEGDIAQFQAPSFGTLSLLEDIQQAPFRALDTAYARNLGWEKSHVESDYLFSYMQSYGSVKVLPGPGGAYYLHWVIEVDAQNIALVKDEDRRVYGTLFIITAEVTSRGDSPKKVIDARKESYVNLSEAEAQSGIRLPFAYSGMFPIVPGAYDVRIVLRNRACPSQQESSCRKAYTFLESAIDVPGSATDRPRLGELILAYGSESRDKPAYRAFSFGSLQVLPNPRAVYTLTEQARVMVEPTGVSGGHRVRFRLVNQDTPQEIISERTMSIPEFRLEPLQHDFALQGFAGGHYRALVDLLDASGKVVDTGQADFDVIPHTAVARPGVRGSWAEIFPEIPGLLEMSLGTQYLNLDEKKRARELLEAAIAANPKLGLARESLAALVLEEGEPDRAVALLEPVYRQVQDRYEVLAPLGEAYFRQKNYALAAEVLEKAITIRRPDAGILNALAVSQFELGKTDRARELLERSLEANPDQPAVKSLLEKWKAGPKKN